MEMTELPMFVTGDPTIRGTQIAVVVNQHMR